MSLKHFATVLCATAFAWGCHAAPASAAGTGSVQGDGKELVMFTITASNVYGANQIKGAEAANLQVISRETIPKRLSSRFARRIASGSLSGRPQSSRDQRPSTGRCSCRHGPHSPTREKPGCRQSSRCRRSWP